MINALLSPPPVQWISEGSSSTAARSRNLGANSYSCHFLSPLSDLNYTSMMSSKSVSMPLLKGDNTLSDACRRFYSHAAPRFTWRIQARSAEGESWGRLTRGVSKLIGPMPLWDVSAAQHGGHSAANLGHRSAHRDRIRPKGRSSATWRASMVAGADMDESRLR